MATPLEKVSLPIEDIITPESVDFWPLAIGWWLLLILIIVSVVGIFLLYRKHKKKWGYRKQALSLIDNVFSAWEGNEMTTEHTCHELLKVLKRTAITAYPNQNIASLHGKAWLALLNSQTSVPLFNHSLQEVIYSQQYQQKINIDINTLKNSCEQWIRQHNSQWQPNNKEANN